MRSAAIYDAACKTMRRLFWSMTELGLAALGNMSEKGEEDLL